MGLFGFGKKEKDKMKDGLEKTRTGFWGNILNTLTGSKIDDDLYDELEEQLILADVGGDVAMKLVDALRDRVQEKGLKTGEQAADALRDIIADEMRPEAEMALDGHPAVILVIGVNGVGKTTSIAKLADYYTRQGKKVMLAAGDTFRAAASEQLEIWAGRAGVPIVKAGEGADPAAVIFDTVKSATARGYDMVIADTAGRLHNKSNLMSELSKISRSVRKAAPEASLETLLVLDAITGQNAISQAKEFCKAADATGIILTKLDGTAKGGCVVAVKQRLGLPVRFIGVGEGIDDLRDFDAREFASALVGTFDERFDADEDGLRGENAKEAAVTAGERRRDVLEGAPTCAAEAEEAAEGSAEETVEGATVEALAEVEDGEAPVVDAQGDAEEAFADAAEEAAAEPDNADLLEAALGRRTHDTLVLETEEDTSAGLEAAELTELDRNAEAVAEAAEEGVFDDAPFTDDELAELAMAAADENAEGEPEPEPEPAPESEKKSFWKRLFE